MQAQRLLEWIGQSGTVKIAFQPIDPRLPGPLARLQEIKYLRTLLTFVLYIAMLAARVWRYDILHVFTASFWSYTLWSIPALVFARLYGKKIVLNYRDGQCAQHLDGWRSAAPTIRQMDCVVPPSESLVEVFARHGIEASVIPNVIDPSRFLYRQRSHLLPRFLHNRGMEDLYNVGCTLRAFARVQQVYPEAELVITHDGPLRGELEALAQQLGLRNCHWLGPVKAERMKELLNEADIYLTSPNLDCFPGSLLECYASGLPVVATAAGGIPYIAQHGETAMLAPLNDDQKLAEGALALLEDPDLTARITANAFASLRLYSGPVVSEAWISLYKDMRA